MGYLAFERGSSSHTVEAYGRDLERYVKALEEKGVTEPDDVTRPLIEEHLEHLAEEGYAPSSVERALSAIKSFHRFMLQEEISSVSPAAALPLPKKAERLPDVLSVRQALALLDQPFPKTAAGQRDRAIIEVLYGCGLRVSELTGLDVGAVSLEDEVVRVIGKGSKERLVPLMGSAHKALAEYLEGRARLFEKRRCGLPECPRRQDLAAVRLCNRRAGRTRRRHRRPPSAYPPPQLCDAHAPGRSRHPHRAGASGPLVDPDDAALYPSRQEPSSDGIPLGASPGAQGAGAATQFRQMTAERGGAIPCLRASGLWGQKKETARCCGGAGACACTPFYLRKCSLVGESGTKGWKRGRRDVIVGYTL